ncbi:conserved hypothetical protein [Candidatus Magnetomoraceae bacterium gMMP-15]
MYLEKDKKQVLSIVPHGRLGNFVPMRQNYIEYFQNLVKYLLKLRRDGDINDDTFEAFVCQAAANFVEAEISERIDMVFEDKISLNNLLEIL